MQFQKRLILISISLALSLAGCAAEEEEADLSGGAATSYPSVSSTSPSAGATGIAVGTTIQVTFDATMDTASVSGDIDTTCAAAVQLSKDDFANCIAFSGTSFDEDKRVFTLTPSANLANSTDYKIRVTTAALDTSGVGLESAYTQATAFTTVSATSTTADTTADTTTTTTDTTTTTTTITWKLPGSGQTTSHTATFGEDSDYPDNGQSYSDNGDGTVTDNNTGLMWQKCSAGLSGTDCATGTASTFNHTDGAAYCDTTLNASALGGHTDWRVPTAFEISLIQKNEGTAPFIDQTAFPNTQNSYWALEASLPEGGRHFAGHFFNPKVQADGSSTLYSMRCVRGNSPALSFTDNGDGTVSESTLGVMWEQCANGLSGAGCATGTFVPQTWEQALVQCEGSTTAGYTDWRLPKRNELGSLIDFSKTSPTINETMFPNSPNSNLLQYWSSTTIDAVYAQAITIYYANTHGSNKSDPHATRCMRKP